MQPTDLIFRGYLVVMVVLIVLFGLVPGGYPNAGGWIAYHVGLLGLGWLISVAPGARRNPVLRFLRWWYPLILVYACFKGIGWNIHLIRPEFLDPALAAADRFLFGRDLTLWMQAHANPVLTELMYFCYTSFYFLAPAVGIPLYVRALRTGGIEQDRIFREFIFAVTFTFLFCYLHFLLTPAGGPVFWEHYPGPVLNLPGGPITAFEQWLFHTGGVVGGAFPSSHVAGAFVITLYAVRQRIAPWLFVTVSVGLAISTMYNGYHYGVDVVYGVIIAAIIWMAAPRLFTRLGGSAEPATADVTLAGTGSVDEQIGEGSVEHLADDA